MNKFIAEWQANAEHLERHGLYDPSHEHDACGVGLIAAIDGKPRREVVLAGISALKAVWHRGAVDADGKTGDGAGIHVEIPQNFFKEHIARTGHVAGGGRLAVGMVFMPKTDLGAQELCRGIVETEILNFGYEIYGWRQVPVDASVIGEKANATRPEIEQIMIANHDAPQEDDSDDGAENGDAGEAKFELDLYIIRRRIERRVLEAHINDFYICSLSCRSIIYKGMFLAEQIDDFYPDLKDDRFESSFAIYHQRYSTNTFPTWRLAQPFRMLAHNGEINTIRGNINWMKCHEPRMVSTLFREHGEDIKPVIQSGSSDSAALDAAFEVLVRAGRPVTLVKTLLIPEAWSKEVAMPEAHRALYSYCNTVMEPWDGPAAIAATDGRWVLAGMDRNGLRPLRYAVSSRGLLVVGSETGMAPLPETEIIEKGRIGPGRMIAVDLTEGRLYHDREIKDMLAADQPYREWVRNITELRHQPGADAALEARYEGADLRWRQHAAGYSMEALELVLAPMIEDAKEGSGSMGDDTPLAVLSKGYRGLHHFFRQQFSQVTNPPIDSLRESRVMSLNTRLGNLTNVLDEDASQTNILLLSSPVLTNADFIDMRERMGDSAAGIDCGFAADGDENALRDAIARIRREAEDAVRGGSVHLILDDSHIGEDRAAIPMILAAGAVHAHLVRNGLRTYTSLNIRSAECLDVHYFAVLIGVGATTVNPYLAQDSIIDRHRRGLVGGLSLEDAIARYKRAADQGLLKIMSKIGISVVSSYRGGYNFEAIGLSRTLVADIFPGMPSRISGIGLAGIQRKVLEKHGADRGDDEAPLPIGDLYRYRVGGETHAFAPELIHMLQSAVSRDSYQLYRKYSRGVADLPPVNLRDLLDFRPLGEAIPVEDVESITGIRRRFLSGSMSLGALSPEAHETLAIAMNRMGAMSCSGEGGEDEERYQPRSNGDNANSSVKQIASARFGVSAAYLNNCSEIEIKIAQGAKPGEGGQLPGFKVTAEIAALRNATAGVTLISPPPHHDIYSIEDLAQLIYDLKQINPVARVSVKLVAQAGIGTVAAGVAKAKADVVLISGHSGGTGASPLSSIKYAGAPWEMGLSEVNQVLTLNRLRHTIKLRADGGIRTGRDIVIAAMLGAEEFGIATTSLVAMGCILVRQCHSNTCPVGICTQDPKLREKFAGSPEKVINLFSFIAEEVREILASLGARSLLEIVGRSDLLAQVSRGSPYLDDLDLNPLLVQADPGDFARHCTLEGRNEVPDTLDEQIIEDVAASLMAGEKKQVAYSIRNTHRAIGARLSSMITRRFGMDKLKAGHVTARLRGSAGQSLGAFLVQGVKLEVFGDANDYVGKGLSGGEIIVRPTVSSPLAAHKNTIIGNTVLYGAIAGKLFAAGQAGERFCVRNSGAVAVIEGCGSNGCEYMTGGIAVILGAVGNNFAAGMTGGMAFVHMSETKMRQRINADTVVFQRIDSAHWRALLRSLIVEHGEQTDSRHAQRLLENWDVEQDRFWQICPKEMIDHLEHPLSDVALADTGD